MNGEIITAYQYITNDLRQKKGRQIREYCWIVEGGLNFFDDNRMTYSIINVLFLWPSNTMKFISALLFLIFVLAAGVVPAYAGKAVSIDVPPASLEKWYKPANKRQVWLHTMFKLRREMQAISEYAKLNDQPGMAKWIARLEKDYNKIADMVPEWEKEIKPRLLPELEM
ncbi:MAG: hypothetical protein KAJ92_06405, partial [Gammaproteobacteria bacterium]|nr:hypothetical protein [Gammaproteobacteria bacterium]